jgi:hypothetical protein
MAEMFGHYEILEKLGEGGQGGDVAYLVVISEGKLRALYKKAAGTLRSLMLDLVGKPE